MSERRAIATNGTRFFWRSHGSFLAHFCKSLISGGPVRLGHHAGAAYNMHARLQIDFAQGILPFHRVEPYIKNFRQQTVQRERVERAAP